MDDIAKLGLDLDTKKLRTAVKDLDAFERKTSDIERTASRLEGMWGKMGGQVAALAASMGVAFSVVKIIQYGDAWATVTNQLRLATTGMAELQRAQEGVYAIAQKTFSSLDATAQLTSKLNRYAADLTGGLEGTLKLVETINKASALGGTAAASQAAGLFQLNQALASGTLRGEELNSVMEQTPIIARAIADGLGLTIGEMRKVAAQGKITSELVVKAMQDQADEIDAAFAKLEPTVAMSLTKLQNSLTKMVGQAGAPAFKALAKSISDLADTIGSTGAIEAMTVAVTAFMNSLNLLLSVLPAVAVGLGAMMVIKQLAPLWTLLSFAMEGAAGRAVALDLALGKANGGMIAARASAAGLLTALGGPWVVAIGAAATAFVFFASEADKARKKMDEFYAAADGGSVSRAVNKIRGRALQLSDPNEGVRKEAFAGLQEDLAKFEKDMVTANNMVRELDAKRADLQAKITNPPVRATARGDVVSPTDGFKSQLAQVEADLAKATKAAKEFGEAYYAALNEARNPDAGGTKAKPRDVHGLLNAVDPKEAEKAAKKLADIYAKTMTEVWQQQQDFNKLMAQSSEDLATAQSAQAAGATTQALDQQLDILVETDNLLEQYKQKFGMLGDEARDVAATSAKTLITQRAQTEAIRQQLKIQTDLNRLPRLANALAVSPEEYELTRLTLEMLEDGVALTEEGARAEALKVRAIQRTTDELDKQASRARDLAEAPAQNWINGLTQLSDDFWTDWVEKGWGAFDDLADGIKSLWKKLQADMLRMAFEPMRNAIMSAMGYPSGPVVYGVPGAGGPPVAAPGGAGAGGGSGAGGGTLWNQLLNFGGAGAGSGARTGSGAGGMNLSSMGSILQMAVASQGGSNLLGFGMLNGGKELGYAVTGALTDFLGLEGASMLGGALNKMFNPANAMGGMFGSGLASLLGMNGKNAGIGGTLGGLAGSFFGGPIGSAIGSFLGQAVGSLIGPKESDHGAVATVDAQGRITNMAGGKRTSETEGAVREAATAISEGQRLLKQLGATLGATVDHLILGTRDASRYSLSDSDGVISTGTVGDPQALVNAALKAVLDKSGFSNPVLEEVRQEMLEAGRSFEDVLEVLGDLSDVLPNLAKPTSEWAQAIKQLDEALAKGGGAADGARPEAMEMLGKAFNQSITDALMQIREPLKKQFGELLESQVQRVSDATALGANMADVLALNAEELAAFVKGAAGSADVFSDLNEQFAALRAQAAGLGQDVAKMDEAFAKARAQIVSSFNDSVADELDRLSNPTMATLKAMLEGQKARVDQAKALGANLAAVERLNALETQRFFEGLNEDQLAALGDYLGVVEDFTGRIGLTLLRLRDEIDTGIEGFSAQVENLQRQRDVFASGGKELLELKQSLTDRYSDLSPQASLDDLRKRFARLTEDAKAGNESAITALPQVADQLVSRSRELFGSTQHFRNDLEGVTRVLEEVGNSATARADAVDAQIAALEQQRDTLIEIRELLSQPDPNMDAISAAMVSLGESNVAVRALLEQYMGLRNGQSAQQGADGAIQAAALAAAAPQPPPVSTYAPQQVGTPQVQQQVAPASTQATGSPTSDVAAAEATDAQTDILMNELQLQREEMRDVNRNLRKLQEIYAVAV